MQLTSEKVQIASLLQLVEQPLYPLLFAAQFLFGILQTYAAAC